MILRGNRQQGTPFIIGENGSIKLERIPLDEKLFRENWLQKLIHENPQILPVDDIESGFAPLIPIGREISTPVGYIDNLYVSPNGYLTIVETKLWRNPEAKREVVGQIIDYAKELSNWTFSQLDEQVRKSNQLFLQYSKGILDCINEFDVSEEEQEMTIIDNLERNLKRGRFLLLIVGDGIRESVEDMVNYLSSSSQLQFTLGLVELQVYRHPVSQELITIPNLITRTREITRAVIKIENNSNASVKVETDFQDEKSSINYIRTTITEQDFFEQLTQNTNTECADFTRKILNDSVSKGYYIDWNTGSFAVKLLDPNGSGLKITLFVVDRKGLIYLMQSGEQLKRLGLDSQLALNYAHRTAQLFQNLTPHQKSADTWNRYPKTLEVKPVYEDFMMLVEAYVNDIIRASKAIE